MERTDLINNLIKENGYKSYLEIGFGDGVNFSNIICENKISVDPNQPAAFVMSSDDYFSINKVMFDIVFVDGLHIAEQVERDVLNSLKFLNKNGVIVIHDCTPSAEVKQLRERNCRDWQGDVWKGIVSLARMGYLMRLIEIESGIVLLKNETKKYKISSGEMTWTWYLNNFKKMLCE
jgi:hypothetical protein